jgi:hypothetical protein
MSPIFAIRIVGVVLLGIVAVHIQGLPWGLVTSAGMACVFLP